MTFSKRMLLSLFFMSIFAVLTVVAQDIPDFDEDFDNDIISFEYPEDWGVEEFRDGTSIIVYSDGSSLDLDELVFGRPRNTFLFRIIVEDGYNSFNNAAAILGFEYRAWADYLRLDLQILDHYFITSEVDEDDINRNDYAMLTAEFVSTDGDEIETAFLVIEVDDEQFVVISGFSDRNDGDELLEMMLAFADTVDTCFPDC